MRTNDDEPSAVGGDALVRAESVHCWPVPPESVLDAQDIRFVIQEFMPESTADTTPSPVTAVRFRPRGES